MGEPCSSHYESRATTLRRHVRTGKSIKGNVGFFQLTRSRRGIEKKCAMETERSPPTVGRLCLGQFHESSCPSYCDGMWYNSFVMRLQAPAKLPLADVDDLSISLPTLGLGVSMCESARWRPYYCLRRPNRHAAAMGSAAYMTTVLRGGGVDRSRVAMSSPHSSNLRADERDCACMTVVALDTRMYTSMFFGPLFSSETSAVFQLSWRDSSGGQQRRIGAQPTRSQT